MVQPPITKSTPSGTFKAQRNGPSTNTPGKELAGTHVKSGRQLREAFVELQNSPDGMDPEPLTVPKCVECAHCGWPVYPRESKVATKKTFARAGITRGPKKDGEEDDDEYSGSDDSRNTEDRLRDELEDLRERNGELEKENIDLREDKEMLEKKLQEKEEAIEELEDRVELLEEEAQRWQDMLDQAETRMDELKLYLDRAGLVSADRERGLVVALQEIAALRETLAGFKRRRNLMFVALEQRLARRDAEDCLAATLRLWRVFIVKDRLTREAEDLERSRHRDVGDAQVQLNLERARVRALKATEARLEGRLRAAGQRLIARALSSSARTPMQAHTWLAWTGAQPIVKLENVLETTKATLKDTQLKLESTTERNAFLEEDYGKVTEERDKLKDQNTDLKDRVEFLQLEGGGGGGGRGKSRELEEKRQEKKKQVAEQKKALDEALAALALEQEKRVREREEFEQEIEALEGRLELAESSAWAGSGNVVPEVDEKSRICPKGQGVLCVGCLKQLVHRSVRPLPPVSKLKASASKQLDKAKEQFFEQELGGAPNVKDEGHTHVWRSRKDPYGIARLTVWPRRASSRGGDWADSPPTSPTSSTPTTGLPALKKSQRLRTEGVSSPLKRSMKDFNALFR